MSIIANANNNDACQKNNQEETVWHGYRGRN